MIRDLKFYVGLVIAATVTTAVVAALLVNIFERKREGEKPFFHVVDIDDTVEDPEIWGKNFPNQYDSYKRTVDMTRTKHGGSEALPHAPTAADPRQKLSQSKIELDPRLKRMWAGYAFAIDFREERGHAYMLDDQTYTDRVLKKPQPGTCMHCHASVYLPYKRLGNGDLFKGFEAMNRMPYAEARKQVSHPVACIDCHDPKTMALRVTRPGFLEGIRTLKASQGVKDYDVNRMATHQEMRSFVCGQCHVEYYFQGPEKRLTYPWKKGLRADEIMDYYEETKFTDWEHAETGTACLKAQHPEFEMWNQGVHARSGVACADCHMAYMRVGAQKVSDHHVQSPVLNINRACQTCHRVPEAELKARVELIQDKTTRMRDIAMDSLMDLIDAGKAAKASGANPQALRTAQSLQRRAQFYLDFVEAENSTGFHAPQEAARILEESLSYSRQGLLVLKDPKFKPTVLKPFKP